MLKRQLAEIEKLKARLAEMEQHKTQLLEKEKEVEHLNATNLATTQVLALARGILFWSKQTQKYLTTTGISQIITKCRACHEFEKLVGRLTPSIQAKKKIELIQQLQLMHFSKVKLDEVPRYNAAAEDLAEVAFQSF